MQKRGQVTIFIVIGIVLLAVIGAFLYFNSDEKTNDLQPQSDALELSATSSSIKTFVEDCIGDESVRAIYLVAAQGGVIYPQDPNQILLTQERRIAYAYKNTQPFLAKENVEAQLNRYLDENILSCFNFQEFRDRGIEIELEGSPRASTQIEKNRIRITITNPIRVTEGGIVTKIDSFQTAVTIRLGHLLDITQELIVDYEKNPQKVDLTLLSSYDVLINAYPFDERTLLYEIKDPQSNFRNVPFIFYTALRQDNINNPPVLEFIAPIKLVKGKAFSGQIIASDPDLDKLEYSSSLSWLKVDASGKVMATPTKIGDFTTTITVTDTQGESDSQEVRITVIE